ncbi:histidine kinase dimerization/phosphoacceptor domain -containing protein [Balneolales bacterium ANBcel1]|nr:histidine kinase dimerization/phosphoacceptor domain -containing protein [Balneolales bacterium ANBcel1]
MSGTQPIKVLLVEDNEDDAALIRLELEKAGYDVHMVRVETSDSLIEALDREQWDVLISDYNLPGFDGMTALELVRSRDNDIPFILVSGTVGEEFAVEAVIAGANDYVMKDNLKRVPVAVRREVRNKRLRDQKREADDKVRESLREKDVMLKEIHHRVKNNLAVISALLTMQSDYVEDERSQELFMDSVGRIKSMALIHEKLYQSELLAKIEMKDYLRELADTIERTYQSGNADIRLELSTDDTTMDITKAIPCGLIVNELLSNAFKHAFTGREKGRIQLKLKKKAGRDHCCELQVSDDGIGVPQEAITGNGSSLGYTIIQGLANQISADLKVENHGGTTVTLCFDSCP